MTARGDHLQPHIPTSTILDRLVHAAPPDTVTLNWLLEHLRFRSFGVVLLLLGVCGLIPVVSPVAGLLLAIPAVQMILAQPSPTFPRRIAEKSIATNRITAVLTRVVPVLRYLERFVRPRWPLPFETTERVIGGFILLLGLCLLAPVPLSNIPVSLAVILIAFAHLEEDGILLLIALTAALGIFGVVGGTVWSVILAAGWATRS